jgi:hypothetical protein
VQIEGQPSGTHLSGVSASSEYLVKRERSLARHFHSRGGTRGELFRSAESDLRARFTANRRSRSWKEATEGNGGGKSGAANEANARRTAQVQCGTNADTMNKLSLRRLL